VEYFGEFVDVACEVHEERGGQVVGSLLAGIRAGTGQVLGQIVVRGRDGAQVRAGVEEALRNASEFDGVLEVAPSVFQVGARHRPYRAS
jgi:hypothetical protein